MFSSSKNTTLHLAIPALESLYRAWSTRVTSEKYAFFKVPLKAAAEKVNEYYEKTETTDAYTLAMSRFLHFQFCISLLLFIIVLDPWKKKLYLAQNWSEELCKTAMDCIEAIVCQSSSLLGEISNH